MIWSMPDENGAYSGAATATITDSGKHVFKKTEARFYRPELDALRFFAFLSVFFAHGFQPSYANRLAWAFRNAGGFGLCLFFLLSSYLITELLLRERSGTGGVHLGSFYVRRILRIWPLYLAMVGFGYVFGLMRPDAPWGTGRLLAYLFLVGNLYTARHGPALNPAGALWSISVEEQFYLLWPSIVKAGTHWLKIVSWLLIPASYFWLWILLRADTSLEPGIWSNSVVQFQFFGIGALIALYLRGTMPKLNGFTRAAMVAAGLALWVVASGLCHLLDSLSVPPWKCSRATA